MKKSKCIVQKNCLFCNSLEGHGYNIAKILPEFKGSRLIFTETENFYVTAELYPILDAPYFLIVIKDHLNTLCELPTICDKELNSIIEFLKDLTGKSGFLMFEHGDRNNKKRTQSVCHAHIHIIFTELVFFKRMEKLVNRLGFHIILTPFDKNYQIIRKLKKFIQPEENYLFFRQNKKGFLIKYNNGGNIRSQFFRFWLSKLAYSDKTFINWKNLDNLSKEILRERLYKNLPLNKTIKE